MVKPVETLTVKLVETLIVGPVETLGNLQLFFIFRQTSFPYFLKVDDQSIIRLNIKINSYDFVQLYSQCFSHCFNWPHDF